MDAFVITIYDIEESVQCAERCIRSAEKFGVKAKKFKAITPESNPIDIAETHQIPTQGFKEVYSRFDRCLSAFLSHYILWNACIDRNEPIIIFEHDAVVVNNLPLFVHNLKVMNLGKPSYGGSITPMKLGRNPLTSKRYFPGAHAYMLSPAGARQLVLQAKVNAAPTDVFLHLENFPWLEEYYPWPVEARDSFTTIQNERGCVAKHNYGAGYGIL